MAHRVNGSSLAAASLNDAPCRARAWASRAALRSGSPRHLHRPRVTGTFQNDHNRQACLWVTRTPRPPVGVDVS